MGALPDGSSRTVIRFVWPDCSVMRASPRLLPEPVSAAGRMNRGCFTVNCWVSDGRFGITASPERSLVASNDAGLFAHHFNNEALFSGSRKNRDGAQFKIAITSKIKLTKLVV